jgi:hypothetical protein
MRNTLLAFALVFGVGCHDAAKDIEKLADRACACKDKACAEKVVDDFAEFAKANKNAKGDEEKAAKEFGRLMECATKAGADMGTMMSKLKDLGE